MSWPSAGGGFAAPAVAALAAAGQQGTSQGTSQFGMHAQPGFGQPAQAGSGFGQPAQAGNGFGQAAAGGGGFGQVAAGGGGFGQVAAGGGGFGQAAAGGGGFGQAAASGGGFGQPAQPLPGSFAFGQQQQQPPPSGGFTFGQQQQQAPPQQQLSPGGFTFGQQQQAQQQAAPSGFTFGQQQPSPGSFTFGQQQQQQQQPSPGAFTFGQQQQQADAQQPPVSSFASGQQASAAAQQAPPAAQAPTAKAKVAFGLALRKRQQGRAPPAALSAAEDGEGEEEEEMDAAAMAAAKAAALASLPKFQGSGGGGAKPAKAAAVAATPPPPPPPRAQRRGGGTAALDAEEEARRAQRASRFAPPPAAAPAAPVAPPPAPAPLRPPSAASGMMAGGIGDIDEEGGADDAEGEGGIRAGAIVGTCEEMCPAPERERRSRLSDIQIFERPDLANSALTSADLAVKRFARTIDDSNNAPEFFRTRGALRRTMAYLRNLLDRQDARLGLIHKFLWDRYRSVRQDLYIQGMDDEFAVGIYEEVVRFHVLSEHELCEEEASITEMEGFNSHLNMEQMNKALISLNDMYNKLAAAGRPAQYEAEFRAYHLLSLMGQHGKFKGDQQAFLSMLQAMRPEVRGSAAIQWVLKLQRAFAAGNFVRFFGLVRQAPYLLACLSHIYFGQIRGRALRTLGDTLAPKAGTPAAVELSWLVEVLMLDSTEQAQQLCAMHGYGTSMQAGVPVAMLIKGGYVDPPPPVPRKRSELVTGMAPASRSMAVTTPALPPMTAEEAALLEQQRQEQLRRFREEEAQRAQQAAEQLQQQQAAAAAAAAAAEQLRQQEEAARLAEEARLREEQLAQQQQAQLEEQQRQQALLLQQQQEKSRRREEEARRQQQLLELQRQQEEQLRAAAEAERRQREAAELERQRRVAAEAAERRRLAELERQRLEELRRQEEERRARREAKRRRAIQTFYLARWRQEARRRVEERARQERLALNLKACRVGMPSKVARAEAAVTAELEELQLDGNSTPAAVKGPQHPAGRGAAIDLPSLAAPLLLQRSPAACRLYWKLLLMPAMWNACSGGQAERQQLQHLQSWLAMQLQRGRSLATAATGSAFVEGPLHLQVPASSSSSVSCAEELTVCLTCLGATGGNGHASNSSSSSSSSSMNAAGAALAGCSAVIQAVPSSSSSMARQHLQQWLPLLSSATAVLPLLLIAATDAAAHEWQEAVAGGWLTLPGPVHVVSIQQAGAAPGAGEACKRNAVNVQHRTPAAYSRQQLVKGLRWLAAHAPSQPALKIAPVEVVVQDALAATSVPVLHSPAAAFGGLPAAQLLCGALHQALELVSHAAERACSSAAAAWRWPPPELAPLPLQSWHDGSSLPALKHAFDQLRTEPAALLAMAEGGSLEALRVAVHLRLAALEADRLPPLVLPLEVEKWFEAQMELARAASAPALPNAMLAAARRQQQQQQQQQRAGSPSIRQKRKWQPAGSPPGTTSGAPAAACATRPARSWAAIVAGGPASTAPTAALSQQAAPAISRLPLWHHLQQQLQVEQQRELGLQEHAALAASGSSLAGEHPPAHIVSSSGADSFAAAPSGAAQKLTLLDRLRQEATEERTATDRLVQLALL